MDTSILVPGTTFQVLANSHTLSRGIYWYMCNILNIAIGNQSRILVIWNDFQFPLTFVELPVTVDQSRTESY